MNAFAEVKSEIKPLQLKSAIEMALVNNPSLKSSKEKLNQNASSTDLVRSYLYPTLTFSMGAGEAQSAANSAAKLFGGNMYESYNSNLTLTQPLFVYGSLSAIRQSEMDREIQLENVKIAERNLSASIIQSYFGAILQHRLLENLKKAKDVLQKSLETTTYREKIGRAQLLDVLQIKTQLASIQPQIENAQVAYDNALNQLSAQMGAKLESGLSQSVPSGTLKVLRFSEVERQLPSMQPTLPELDINQKQIRQVSEARSAAMGKHLPQLKLQGSYLTTAYNSSDWFSSQAGSWNAGLVLTIPIFEGFSSKYERGTFLSQELQLESTRSDLENTISLNQMTAKKSVSAAEISLTTAIEADKLAQQSLSEATRLYKYATIDFRQFLTIQQTALTAASNLEQIKYNSILAYANYFTASGRPLRQLVDLLSE